VTQYSKIYGILQLDYEVLLYFIMRPTNKKHIITFFWGKCKLWIHLDYKLETDPFSGHKISK